MPKAENIYTIVGLSVNLKNRAQAFLTELWEHRWEVMLCHDEAYRTTPHAIAAIVGDEVVGIDPRDGQTEHVSFTVRADFEGAAPTLPVPVDAWRDWGYGLPALPHSQQDVLLLNAARALRRMMQPESTVRKADMLHRLEAYEKLSRHDVSRENRALIQEATAWLLASSDPDLQQWGKVYARLHPAMNEEERLDERVNRWWPTLMASPEADRLWRDWLVQQGWSDTPAPEQLSAMQTSLLEVLHALPGELPRLLDSDAREFFKGLFYLDTPREVLSRIYGCIILCCRVQQALERATLVKAPEALPGAAQIPREWLLTWAEHQADPTIEQCLHRAVTDYELERTNPTLAARLDSVHAACRPHLDFSQQVENHFASGSCTFQAGSVMMKTHSPTPSR